MAFNITTNEGILMIIQHKATVCDWISEKPAATHTIARHTFHHQMIAVNTNKQFRQVLVLKVAQAAFAVACFCGLSDVHKCIGGL